MSEQARITPDEVLAAYAKTGLRPVFGVYTDPERGEACGCPLSALYVAATGEREFDGSTITDWASNIFDTPYRFGFIVGVDGEHDDEPGPRRRQGYADGLAVRQAIIEAGLMEVGA